MLKIDKISIATDIGMITDNIRRHLYKSKLIVLESNYDSNMLMMGSYPYSLKKRVMSDKGHYLMKKLLILYRACKRRHRKNIISTFKQGK